MEQDFVPAVVLYLHSTSNHNLGWQLRYSEYSCIISSFYIKPQQNDRPTFEFSGCIISSFYIKPQQSVHADIFILRCIISSFYIKPQRITQWFSNGIVVLYLHSTSNHNNPYMYNNNAAVVLYLHSTSNHTNPPKRKPPYKLYYIFILHQTTTCILHMRYERSLYYIFILHQTTTLYQL